MPSGVYVRTPEHRAIISAALRGKAKTPEHRAKIAASATHHGMRHTTEYEIWAALRQRCQNPRDKDYASYGGRGIQVCERWQKFENFYADMGARPEGLSLDRIDNNGDYEPSNCRWATWHEQRMNQRRMYAN